MELSEPATAIALILGTKINLETKKAAQVTSDSSAI